jgi:hypothetical protein
MFVKYVKVSTVRNYRGEIRYIILQYPWFEMKNIDSSEVTCNPGRAVTSLLDLKLRLSTALGYHDDSNLVVCSLVGLM